MSRAHITFIQWNGRFLFSIRRSSINCTENVFWITCCISELRQWSIKCTIKWIIIIYIKKTKTKPVTFDAIDLAMWSRIQQNGFWNRREFSSQIDFRPFWPIYLFISFCLKIFKNRVFKFQFLVRLILEGFVMGIRNAEESNRLQRQEFKSVVKITPLPHRSVRWRSSILPYVSVCVEREKIHSTSDDAKIISVQCVYNKCRSSSTPAPARIQRSVTKMAN